MPLFVDLVVIPLAGYFSEFFSLCLVIFLILFVRVYNFFSFFIKSIGGCFPVNFPCCLGNQASFSRHLSQAFPSWN